MIELCDLPGNAVCVKISDELHVEDFGAIAPEIDRRISEHGAIRVLLDLTDFEGWASIAAAQTHFGFVKDHIHKVERIAILTSKEWQHWIAAVVSTFVAADEKCFDEDEADEAKSWLAA